MSKYFGRPWPSPFCENSEQAPTPVGELCIWCDEAIEDGDSGVIDAGGAVSHRNCFLREIFGSKAHIAGECSCFVPGAADPDPPGMTRRQAADAAIEELRKRKRISF